MRGPRAAVLFAVADGERHLWRQRPGILTGEGVFRAGPALAAGLVGDHGGRLHHLCAVPDLLAGEAGKGWGDGLRADFEDLGTM